MLRRPFAASRALKKSRAINVAVNAHMLLRGAKRQSHNACEEGRNVQVPEKGVLYGQSGKLWAAVRIITAGGEI